MINSRQAYHISEEHLRFYPIVMELTVIAPDNDYEEFEKVFLWCKNLFKRKNWDAHPSVVITTDPISWKEIQIHSFYFKKEEDAFLFALTWCWI